MSAVAQPEVVEAPLKDKSATTELAPKDGATRDSVPASEGVEKTFEDAPASDTTPIESGKDSIDEKEVRLNHSRALGVVDGQTSRLVPASSSHDKLLVAVT
eukprot:scaffold230_cov353-Prasinococcus_capsulatus_cf.AAC.3